MDKEQHTTSTNWSPRDLKGIRELKKLVAEEHLIGDMILELVPIPPPRFITGANGQRWVSAAWSSPKERMHDLALEIGMPLDDVVWYRNEAIRRRKHDDNDR